MSAAYERNAFVYRKTEFNVFVEYVGSVVSLAEEIDKIDSFVLSVDKLIEVILVSTCSPDSFVVVLVTVTYCALN